VPIVDAPTFDGRRDLSRSFQREIDAVIDRLADELDVSCHRLDPGSREEWVDTALLASGLPLHPPQIDLFSGRRG
jgi:hypothetical protein